MDHFCCWYINRLTEVVCCRSKILLQFADHHSALSAGNDEVRKMQKLLFNACCTLTVTLKDREMAICKAMLHAEQWVLKHDPSIIWSLSQPLFALRRLLNIVVTLSIWLFILLLSGAYLLAIANSRTHPCQIGSEYMKLDHVTWSFWLLAFCMQRRETGHLGPQCTSALKVVYCWELANVVTILQLKTSRKFANTENNSIIMFHFSIHQAWTREACHLAWQRLDLKALQANRVTVVKLQEQVEDLSNQLKIAMTYRLALISAAQFSQVFICFRPYFHASLLYDLSTISSIHSQSSKGYLQSKMAACDYTTCNYTCTLPWGRIICWSKDNAFVDCNASLKFAAPILLDSWS